MAFFKFMQGDNKLVTYGLLLIGVLVAFYTIMDRLTDDSSPEILTHDKLVITEVSFIKLKLGMTEVLLRVPFLPEYSESWQDNPKVRVNWHIFCRGDLEYQGSAMAMLKPPYDRFIFSVQEDLLKELSKYHSERMFLIEDRNRIIREVNRLELAVLHPETGKVLDRFVQLYDPDQRRKETWAY